MIIQLRGTSGSGKTTAMRRIMEELSPVWQPVYSEGRKKPAFYFISFGSRNVSVLGHYESPCGGCDTFKNYTQLQDAVKCAAFGQSHVLMEGLMLSDDVQQTVKMFNSLEFNIRPESQFRVLYLTTDIELCIERVKQRRAAKGKDGIFNYNKLRNRHEQIMRTRPRLEAAGIYCRRASADQAPKLVLDWINGLESRTS